MISLSCDLFNMLLVVNNLQLKTRYSFIILLFKRRYLLVQLSDLFLFTLDNTVKLLFWNVDFLLQLVVFVLQLSNRCLEIVKTLWVLILFQFVCQLSDCEIFVDYGIEGCFFHLLQVDFKLTNVPFEYICLFQQALYLLRFFMLISHQFDDLVLFFPKLFVQLLQRFFLVLIL